MRRSSFVIRHSSSSAAAGAERADLHLHSRASDGMYPPDEVVRRARACGLKIIALTDHDITSGVQEAQAEAGSDPVVVPAVEINTDYGPYEVHILGYFVDVDDAVFQERLATRRRVRRERVARIVARLAEVGISISLDNVLARAATGAVGRPHVAAELAERRFAPDVREAFRRYLIRGAPGFVERDHLSPQEAVAMIREAGGVAVFAHPGTIGMDEMIPKLVDDGLRGLEVFYPEHSSSEVDHYNALAKKLNLIPTGGSDWHGEKGVRIVGIGQATCRLEVVEALQEASSGARRSSDIRHLTSDIR